jgi:hypothetical protein
VVTQILRKVDCGTRVIFVPGNHDEFAREYAGRLFAGSKSPRSAAQKPPTAGCLRVLHGDRFDGVITFARWLAHLGDWAYGMALRGTIFSPHSPPFRPSLLVAVGMAEATKVKNAVEYISRFEEVVAQEAAKRGVDGVVCGISTMPKSRSATSFTSMTEIGLKAAVPLSKMPRGIWRFFTGPILRRDPSQEAREAFRPVWPAFPKPRLYPRRAKRLQPGPIPGTAAHLKIIIVTDAWSPQVNGVVRTLETLGKDLGKLGHSVRYITPLGRRTFPLPTYPEIRLALFQRRALMREFREFVARGNVLDLAVAVIIGAAFATITTSLTTAFHTRFAEYVHARAPVVPEKVIWRWLRWFHHPPPP